MPFIADIVQSINETIKASLNKSFQPSLFYGLSTLGIKVISKDSFEIRPAMVDLNGEITLIELTDINNMVVYHKIISNVHGRGKSNYGESFEMTDTTEMAMIVFGWSNKLRLTADQAEAILRVNMPYRIESILPDLGLNKCIVSTTGTEHDKIKIFRQEFPQSQYFLRPENILFQIKYRIETSFNKACFNQCCPDS